MSAKLVSNPPLPAAWNRELDTLRFCGSLGRTPFLRCLYLCSRRIFAFTVPSSLDRFRQWRVCWIGNSWQGTSASMMLEKELFSCSNFESSIPYRNHPKWGSERDMIGLAPRERHIEPQVWPGRRTLQALYLYLRFWTGNGVPRTPRTVSRA